MGENNKDNDIVEVIFSAVQECAWKRNLLHSKANTCTEKIIFHKILLQRVRFFEEDHIFPQVT